MTNPGTVIYKYPLNDFPGQVQELQLPLGARLVTVGIQEQPPPPGYETLPTLHQHVLWAQVEKDAPLVPYQIICQFTGQEMSTNIRYERYLGTTTDKMGLVRHWFECLSR